MRQSDSDESNTNRETMNGSILSQGEGKHFKRKSACF